ncbi:MAG: hypothetical protein AAFZ18_39465 [Myxococcota bacterium]
MKSYLLTSLLFAAPLSACLQVDAEVPKACFLESGVEIPAVTVSGVDVSAAVDALTEAGYEPPSELFPNGLARQTFTREGLDAIPQTFDDFGATGDIRLLFVEIDAVQGLDSFAELGRVAVLLAPTDGSLEPVSLAVCDNRQGCDTSGRSVLLQGNANQDLMPYLRAESLDFTLEIGGIPPLDAWTFDVDVCMSGGASFAAGL